MGARGGLLPYPGRRPRCRRFSQIRRGTGRPCLAASATAAADDDLWFEGIKQRG
jgi:hypothetical protein